MGLAPLVAGILIALLTACAGSSTPQACSSNIAGEYEGTAFNETFSQGSGIILSFEQSGCMIQGDLSVSFPLVGSGRLAGLVSESERCTPI